MIESTDDFSFNIGDVVKVKGLRYWGPGVGHQKFDDWLAKIADRWYDEECLDHTPFWYRVEPLSGELPYPRSNGIVHEAEVLGPIDLT